MMERDEKSIKTSLIILAILSAVFIPFSIGWYDILDSHCNKKPKNQLTSNPFWDKTIDCDNKSFHWAVFLDVNGIIFGLPQLSLLSL